MNAIVTISNVHRNLTGGRSDNWLFAFSHSEIKCHSVSGCSVSASSRFSVFLSFVSISLENWILWVFNGDISSTRTLGECSKVFIMFNWVQTVCSLIDDENICKHAIICRKLIPDSRTLVRNILNWKICKWDKSQDESVNCDERIGPLISALHFGSVFSDFSRFGLLLWKLINVCLVSVGLHKFQWTSEGLYFLVLVKEPIKVMKLLKLGKQQPEPTKDKENDSILRLVNTELNNLRNRGLVVDCCSYQY